jgi:uncharacterized protein YggE
MNNFKKPLIVTLLLATLVTTAQNKTITNDEKPYIEVVGTAELHVIPDEIYISIIIQEKYEDKKKVTIQEQEEKLTAAIKSIGIDANNLSLSDANADYVKIKWQRKDVLTKKDYTLKVATATTVGQVFQKLDEIEIKDAHISKVSHSKIDSLKKEVKLLAMKSAKDKADYLLNVIGEKTGKPLVVTESNNNNVLTANETMRLPQRNINSIVNTIQGVNSKQGGIPDFELQF